MTRVTECRPFDISSLALKTAHDAKLTGTVRECEMDALALCYFDHSTAGRRITIATAANARFSPISDYAGRRLEFIRPWVGHGTPHVTAVA